MFTFKTKVLGVTMEVSGEFVNGDYELNDLGGFEIEGVTHQGVDLEFDGLCDEVLNTISEDALKAAVKCAMASEPEQ